MSTHSEPGNISSNEQSLTVVGIGASAGGLAALHGFFDVLPNDTGMAFVVVTHMDPERESLLPELLQTHTQMTVRQVQAEVLIEANHVYVVPPNRRIIVTDSHLDIEEFDEPRGRRLPIDYFFRSLASVHRDAVAIILSGGGTDGAVGVKDIKEQGGLLLVQDPDEAEHDGMPRAAIATGLADLVLPVRELSEKLVAYQRNGIALSIDTDTLSERDRDLVQRILVQVQTRTGHDFSQYKQSTLLRRIERRLHLTGYSSLDSYLMYLRHTPDESKNLFNDLLIGVTNFFRDQESWQVLAEQVLPKLFEDKETGQSVRVWTIGCSTGEEAYTVSILLLEQAARLQDRYIEEHSIVNWPIEIQVFASDLDDAALVKAREGLYPETIEVDVSPERLSRFFIKEGHYYRVRRELRDIVLFTNHSVLRDPPFSRVDLISCRNLLIYLNRDLQKNVLDIFHYALRPSGFLFLGSAESADMVNELFRTLDKTHRVYQARPWQHEYPHIPSLPLTAPLMLHGVGPHGPFPASPSLTSRSDAAGTFHHEALEAYGPPSILVNEDYHVLHVSETAGRYLLIRRGILSNNLLELIRPELQLELRAAVFEAFYRSRTVVTSAIPVQFNGTPHAVVLFVRPNHSPESSDVQNAASSEKAQDEASQTSEDQSREGYRTALVFFMEDESSFTGPHDLIVEASTKRQIPTLDEHDIGPAGDISRTRIAQLQAELSYLRERLRVSTEEYESSTEELKAANEELQSVNEEYRSTTEELETSKEELQSVNEELQTVNIELKSKLDEITRINSDLENLMASTQIATLFLDRELSIKRFTPNMEQLFNILPGDRGRSITHLASNLEYDRLTEDAAQVLRTLVPIEQEIRSRSGRWYLVGLRPYRTIEDRIDGVVLTFVDITALKEAEGDLRDAKAYNELIVDMVHEGLLVLEADMTVRFANNSFLEMFHVTLEETAGHLIYHLGNGQWNVPVLRQMLEQVLPQEKDITSFRVEHEFESIGQRIMLLRARRLRYENLILLAVEDITEREQHEQTLRAINESLEDRIQERTHKVHELSLQLTMVEHQERRRIAQLLHDELQQQLFGIKIQLSFMRNTAGENSMQHQFDERDAELNEAIAATRRLSSELNSPVPDNEDLVEIIHWLSDQMWQQFGLKVQVEADGTFPLPETGKRVLLFQTLRELLFNVVKHANVLEVNVRLQKTDVVYSIEIMDGGIGFDPDQVFDDSSSAGQGLSITRDRIRLIGGHFEIKSAPGTGTHFEIIVPVEAQPT